MKTQYLLNRIQFYLKAKGVNNPELLEELSDHYLTMYESAQDLVNNDVENLNSIKQNINNLNLNQLNMDNNTQTTSRYVKLGTALIFSFSFIYFTTSSMDYNSEPPSIWPVQMDLQEINSGYGMMIHPIHETQKMHKGIDIKGNIGEPVYATSDGVVSQSISQETGYGNFIVVDHDSIYQSKYCHLSELLVNTGDVVKKGDIIGKIGSSGRSSMPHLHYEVLMNGKNVDPVHYL